MSKLKLVSLLVAVAVGFVVSAYGISYAIAARDAAAVVPAPVQVTGSSTRAPDADTQIAFWSMRVAERTNAYLDLTLLGQAFARKARESSDIGYYERAQRALRQALRINPEHVPAAATLSTVLYSMHDFNQALATARPVAGHPHGLQALATVGDAHFALGQYDRAQDAYARLVRRSPSPAGHTRMAFLAELRGKTDGALAFSGRAAALAREFGDYGESLAWYELQRGELAYRAGRLGLAESHYRAALELFGDYPPGLAGLAKAKAARGDYASSIELYERATAIAPQPDLLAALGEVYAAAGNDEKASEQFATVRVLGKLASSNRQVHNRQLAIFYADQGIRLAESRRLALAELRVRRDVYGFDAAAWALARSGRCAQALSLSRKSLRLGTKDALLYFHRGYAEGCAGHRGAMRTWYARALELNPSFSIRWAPVARAALTGS
jgi:tetratricopeptide (TPR) repeat protein